MNREQAEHILDAYACMRIREYDKDASDALREVILDAMTEYRSKPTTTWPGITLPSTNYPRDWDYALKPQTICPDYTPKVTWTGVDPTQNISTVSTVDGTAIYQDGVVKVVGE